jgi:hypothetical protein
VDSVHHRRVSRCVHGSHGGDRGEVHVGVTRLVSVGSCGSGIAQHLVEQVVHASPAVPEPGLDADPETVPERGRVLVAAYVDVLDSLAEAVRDRLSVRDRLDADSVNGLGREWPPERKGASRRFCRVRPVPEPVESAGRLEPGSTDLPVFG